MTDRNDTNVVATAPGFEWRLAGRLARGRVAGRLSGSAQAIAADLGKGGSRAALGLLACIALLGALGAVHDATNGLAAFDIDAEVPFHGPVPEPNNVPAVLSTLLLLGASGLALLAAMRMGGPTWLAVAAVFAFMGIDELVAVHDRLGDWLGIPWLIPYTPVIVVAGAIWLLALRKLWTFPSARALWLGGAIAWICAQGLEAVWVAVGSLSGPMPEFALPEEMLEMLGSAMFLLALYLVSQREAGRPT